MAHEGTALAKALLPACSNFLDYLQAISKSESAKQLPRKN